MNRVLEEFNEDTYRTLMIRLREVLTDFDIKKSNGQSLLHESALINFREKTKALIDLGANVNIKDNNGATPLHIAAENCHIEIVKLLLENGAEINVQDKSGYIPLKYALEKQCKEVEALLLNYNNMYWTVEHGYQELVKALIEQGANINAKDSSGYTPLHWAKDVKMVELLIKNNAEINAVDNKGYTLLHWAAKQGYQEIVELLVQHKADVNIKDKTGYIPLHWAKDVKMVELLIKNNAEINAVDNKGYTMLHWAAKQGYQEIAELLIENNAEIVRAKDGKLPSELAKDKLVCLTVKTYEQAKEIERVKKQTDAEKEAEAQAHKEKEEAEKAKKAALDKDLKETEEKLKEVLQEKTTALDELLKLQKEMREFINEEPIIEKVLSDVKEEFSKCHLAGSLDSIVSQLDEINHELTTTVGYSSQSGRPSFEDTIDYILKNTDSLGDKTKSKVVAAVADTLNMLKRCGSQSEDKLYLITDKVDEIKDSLSGEVPPIEFETSQYYM